MAWMNFLSRWNSRDFPLPLETRARTPALPGVGVEEEAAAAEEVVVEVVGAGAAWP